MSRRPIVARRWLALVAVVSVSCGGVGDAGSNPPAQPVEAQGAVSVPDPGAGRVTPFSPDTLSPSTDSGASWEELVPAVPVTTAPPGVVRASILERQEFSLECFRRHGFDGEIQEDSGVLFDVPPDQQERFMEVNAVCLEEEAQELSMARLSSSLVAIGGPRWWPAKVLASSSGCHWSRPGLTDT